MKFSEATDQEIKDHIFKIPTSDMINLKIYEFEMEIFEGENWLISPSIHYTDKKCYYSLLINKLPKGYKNRGPYEIYFGPFPEFTNIKDLFNEFSWSVKFTDTLNKFNNSLASGLTFEELKQILIDIEGCKKLKSFL